MFQGRRKTWWHSNIRGHNGRYLGVIENDGNVWTVQRRFALKQLKDLGFGRKSLDSVMIQEVDEVIDKMLSIGGSKLKRILILIRGFEHMF